MTGEHFVLPESTSGSFTLAISPATPVPSWQNQTHLSHVLVCLWVCSRAPGLPWDVFFHRVVRPMRSKDASRAAAIQRAVIREAAKVRARACLGYGFLGFECQRQGKIRLPGHCYPEGRDS